MLSLIRTIPSVTEFHRVVQKSLLADCLRHKLKYNLTAVLTAGREFNPAPKTSVYIVSQRRVYVNSDPRRFYKLLSVVRQKSLLFL